MWGWVVCGGVAVGCECVKISILSVLHNKFVGFITRLNASVVFSGRW